MHMVQEQLQSPAGAEGARADGGSGGPPPENFENLEGRRRDFHAS